MTKILTPTDAINHNTVRLNAHAEDITELARRIEKLENYAFERIGELAERIEQLQAERVGNDRTFRKVISDNAELADRVKELEERLAFLTARHNRITEPAAQERGELARRIEQLERLLEKGHKKED